MRFRWPVQYLVFQRKNVHYEYILLLDEKKQETSRIRIGTIPKAQKSQKVFGRCSGRYEKLEKVENARKSALAPVSPSAREMLQTFGYSVLKQMGELFESTLLIDKRKIVRK